MIGLVKSKKTVYSNDEHEIVNNITGEILEKPDNVFMRRITVEDLFDEEEAGGSGIKFMSDITYVRSFRGNGVLFRNELTLQETSVTMFLQDFVCYDDCILRTNGSKNGNPLTIHQLADMYGVKFDTFRKTMRSLREKEIIAYHNCGTVNNNSMKLITLNPYIFCRGMNVDKWVVKYFSNSKWAKVQRQKVKQSD